MASISTWRKFFLAIRMVAVGTPGAGFILTLMISPKELSHILKQPVPSSPRMACFNASSSRPRSRRATRPPVSSAPASDKL